jgi:hypothetical protein
MPLPITFQFSQNNLQDYVDCPRRFELRHLLRLEWPALQSEPVLEHEQQMALGQRFHRMVQQHLSGIPAGLLAAQASSDPDLQRWWNAFLTSGILESLPAVRCAERQLSAPFPQGANSYVFRLLAQYDLLAIEPGRRAVILDWKTGAGNPNRTRLQNRLQTRLYLFLLCLAGSYLNGSQPIQPEQVEMIYWFSEQPQKPIRFAYCAAQYAADERTLRELVAKIHAAAAGPAGDSARFLLTPDPRKCAFCNYRSLCRRGVQAGNTTDLPYDLEPPDDAPLELDFDQIEPISWQ